MLMGCHDVAVAPVVAILHSAASPTRNKWSIFSGCGGRSFICLLFFLLLFHRVFVVVAFLIQFVLLIV